MSWTHILGHRDRIEAFRRIVARGRLAHAYLFVGPTGVGKLLFARELAKALLCEGLPPHPQPLSPGGARGAAAAQPLSPGGARGAAAAQPLSPGGAKGVTAAQPLSPGGAKGVTAAQPLSPGGAKGLDACDRCDACRLVDAGTHPDLLMVGRPEDKNELPIAILQQLCHDFSFKPARGHGKMCILDDADDLNDEAANCFLKTLEEPPPNSLFVLIGTSIDRQLTTIRSRCQFVRFAPLADTEVRAVLQKHGIQDAGMLDRLQRQAFGSPGQALALADESLWQFRVKCLQAFTRQKMDSFSLGRDFVEFVEKAGKEAALQRRRAGQMLRLLVSSFTDVIAMQVGAAARSADSAELPLLAALAERADSEKMQALIERCLETEAQLGRYVQVSLVLEGLLDALAQIIEGAGPLPIRYQGFNA